MPRSKPTDARDGAGVAGLPGAAAGLPGPGALAHLAYARAVVRTLGPPAARRAVPLYVGVAIAAGIVFGPNGMSAADLVAGARASAPLRLGLWTAWTLATLPAARALLASRDYHYLRHLTPHRGVDWAVIGGMLAAIHALWLWLWLRGGGPAAGVAAMLYAAGLLAVIAIRARDVREHAVRAAALALLVAGLVLGGAGAAAPVLALAGLATLAAAVPAAWVRAPERAPGSRGVAMSRRAAPALAHVYLAAIWRTRAATWGRAVIAVALGAALAAAAGRANALGPDALAEFLLGVGAVSLSVAAGGFGGPVIEAERQARWLIASAGAPDAAWELGAAMAAGVPGALLGVALGLGAGMGAGASAPTVSWLAAAGGLEGLALALVALRGARWSELPDGLDGSRIVMVEIGAALGALLAVAAFGQLAVIALVATAAALVRGGRRSW